MFEALKKFALKAAGEFSGKGVLVLRHKLEALLLLATDCVVEYVPSKDLEEDGYNGAEVKLSFRVDRKVVASLLVTGVGFSREDNLHEPGFASLKVLKAVGPAKYSGVNGYPNRDYDAAIDNIRQRLSFDRDANGRAVVLAAPQK